ncbi:hypothetical protein NG798_26190 [Ancylothrix sp. C2]|nr:hypothetical protein [Ancylothrix sp. D3o]MCT7953294.1 hypothetical protein [Ancylothrix sp. D3o]
MLPPFYQTILEQYLTKAQLITLNMRFLGVTNPETGKNRTPRSSFSITN